MTTHDQKSLRTLFYNAWPTLTGAGILIVTVLVLVWLYNQAQIPVEQDRKGDPTLVTSVSGDLHEPDAIPPTPIPIRHETPEEASLLLDLSSGSQAAKPLELPAETPEPEEPVSELKKRIADWRYMGHLKAGQKGVAVIERVNYPDRKQTVLAGQLLEGVTVDEIHADRIVVSLERDRDEIYLSSGPAFDLTDFVVPVELAEDPETLAEVVYAQTLGMYAAKQPDVQIEDSGVSSESEAEMWEELSDKNSWEAPYYGESAASWIGRVAEGLGDQDDGTPEALDPTDYPLSEERRLRLLGYTGKTGN